MDTHVAVQVSDASVIESVAGRYVPLRYVISLLGSVGVLCALMVRSCMNVAILAMANMTDPDDGLYANGSADQCPPEPRDLVNATDRHEASSVVFDWSPETKSLVLSVFYYGYVICQIPGGLIVNYWSAQHAFGLSVLLSGIVCALLPLAAQWSVSALIVGLFFMGLFQGPEFPAVLAMAGDWAPVHERSTICLMTASGYSLGSLLSPIITGILCESTFLGGWPAAFYLFGLVSCLWFGLWMIFARHHVRDHPWISDAERELILRPEHKRAKHPVVCPPWKKVFTCSGFYGAMLSTALGGAGNYVLYTCYPLYMKTVLNYDIMQDSLLTAAPQVPAYIVAIVAGIMADFIIARRWFSIIVTRKLFVIFGGLATAGCIAAVGYVNCDRVLAVVMVTASCGFFSFTNVGPYISLLEMAPQFVGILFSVVNTANNVGGFLCPMLVELLTQGKPSRSRWQLVFFITASFYACGTLVYVLLGTSDDQKWGVDVKEVTVTVSEDAPLVPEANENTSLLDGNTPAINSYGSATHAVVA